MKQKTFNAKNIPNIISVFRIILVPVYVLIFFGIIPSPVDKMYMAGILFLLAGFSDALDGFLARRNQWITDIGKLLDPFADKLLEVAVVVCIAIRFRGPFVILAAIIITKEILMVVGAYLILSKSSYYVSAVWCGKLATLVWYLLICVVHFFPNFILGDMLFVNCLCILLILLMIMAFVIYVFNYATQIQSTKEVLIHKKNEDSSDS